MPTPVKGEAEQFIGSRYIPRYEGLGVWVIRDRATGRRVDPGGTYEEVEPESTPKFLSPAHRQNLNAWRRGADAEIATADRVLVQLDIRIEELPDHLLLTKEAPKIEIPREVQERIHALHKLNWSFREIGAMVGVNRDTVRRHVRKGGM